MSNIKTKRCPSKYQNYSYTGPHDAVPPDYSNITKNYDAIINLLKDENYEEVCNSIFDGISINHLMRSLQNYCVDKNDVNMLSIITSNKTLNDEALENIIVNSSERNHFDIFKFCIENVVTEKFMKKSINFIVSSIMAHRQNAFTYLKVIINSGYKFTDRNVMSILYRNNIEAIQYLIDNDYDIQKNYNNVASFSYTVDVLKLLQNNNIDITTKLDNIPDDLLWGDKLDTLIWIVDNFPDLDLKYGLNRACRNNNIKIIKYFLNKGFDINDITITNSNLRFETIKFLIDCGYPSDSLNLNLALTTVFIDYLKLDKVCYLLGHGANIEHIINNYNHPQFWSGNFSIIEYIIMQGKLTYIKFLIENYYDLIQINDMFLIACANGRIDIAKYLLGFNVDVNMESVMVACFFGHLDIVLMLLGYGLCFEDYDDDLFEYVIVGEYDRIKMMDIYDKIINNGAFINDIYNYGNDYCKIIDVLIKYNVPVRECNYLSSIKSSLCGTDFYRYIVECGHDVNKKFDGMTLLESGIKCNNVDVVEMLLQMGACFDGSLKNMNENIKKVLAKYGIDDDGC